MKKKRASKKIIWIVSACLVVFVVGLALYVSGALSKISLDNFSSQISFLNDNLHTGLINDPGMQLALNSSGGNGNRFAYNNKNTNSGASKIPGNMTGNSPIVLFDVSSRPIAYKTNEIVISLVIGLSAFFVIGGAYLLWIRYKKKVNNF